MSHGRWIVETHKYANHEVRREAHERLFHMTRA
jgi:hypothetical protein